MIAAQLDCDISEALNRLQIFARATDRTLDEVALDVLDRVIRFGD